MFSFGTLTSMDFALLFLSLCTILYSLVLILFLASNFRKFVYKGFIVIILLLIFLFWVSEFEKVFTMAYGSTLLIRSFQVLLRLAAVGLMLYSLSDFIKVSQDLTKAFNVKPVVEVHGKIKKKSRGKAHKLKPGYSYFIDEDKPTLAYKLFDEFLAEEKHGLVLTKESEKRIRDEHKLQKTPIIEITADFTRTMRLENLLFKIDEFVKTSKKAVVMIDCADRLITNIGFDDVLHFIQNLRDIMMQNNSILIISTNSSIFETKQSGLIKAELEVIKG